MRPPTDSQWEAVRETDAHLLVAAGAGSGKTFTVVARILYLLGVEIRGERVRNPLRLGDIAAITFTNQAAADLKAKLRAALREEGLREAAYEVDLARIGTIHSFCGEVLRDFALRAGRAPASTILQEGEGAALAAEVTREALLESLETGAVPGLRELLAVWSVRDVEEWVGRLIGESDRLARLRAGAEAAGPDPSSVTREQTILGLAGLALERLEARLVSEAAVDFDRMITWTRDLIRDHESARRALQRRIRVLIIDEFQDVDPVQKEIAYLLAEPGSGRRDTPRLMLVGDPKQSIYRFRRADVTVWRTVERDFRDGGQGRVVPLEENFRSVAPVLGFVDATVGPILDEPLREGALRDFEVPYAPLRSKRDDGPAERAVEFLLVPPREDDGKCRRADEVRAIEAEAVARRMRELEAEGIGWKDMAVLLVGWGALNVYQGALERAGIPTYALRSEGFFDRREVVDLILALETARDPRDDRALFGFLRSPFVGVTDETLLRIARQATRPYWEHLGDIETREPELLAWGRALLERHIRLRDRVPVATLLSSMLEESGYLAHLALLEGDGPQAIANVRQFLRMADGFADHGVGDFLRTVRETRARGDRVAEARLYGEADDVVTITSVHSAKGLEWQVVFWCDLVRGPGSGHQDKLLLGRDRMVLGAPDLSAKEQAEEWQTLAEELDLENDAERKRLWYVAATRAKDRLVLCGVPQGQGGRLGGTPAGELVRRFFPAIGENVPEVLAYQAADGATYEAVVRVAAPDEVEAGEALAAGGAGASEPLPVASAGVLPPPLEAAPAPVGRSRHSATELLAYHRCPTRHWLRYVAGLREPPVERSGPAWETAVARGQVVHDVLEHLASEEDLDALLEDAIGRWAPEAPPPGVPAGREYRERLRAEIEAASGHPTWAEAAGRPGARRELPFLRIHREGVYAEGKIDLAAPAPAGGLDLVDVKTGGGGNPGELAKKYEAQKDVYVVAASAIAATPVRRFAFHFSRGGPAAEDVDDEFLRQARERVERAVKAMGEGRPPLTRFPGECAWCGFRRVGACPGRGGGP